jgi:hypothetical protein
VIGAYSNFLSKFHFNEYFSSALLSEAVHWRPTMQANENRRPAENSVPGSDPRQIGERLR